MKETNVGNRMMDAFIKTEPQKSAFLLQMLPVGDVYSILTKCEPKDVTAILTHFNVDLGTSLLKRLPTQRFVELCQKMDPSIAAQFLSRMSRKALARKLTALPPALANEVKDILTYPAQSAGALMDPSVLKLKPEATAEEVLAIFREKAKKRIFELAVVSAEGKYLGMVTLQTLVLSEPNERVGDLMDSKAPAVSPFASREEVVEIFEQAKITTLPVVNLKGVLVGVIRYSTLVNTSRDEAVSDLVTMVGASPDEEALSPPTFAVRKRLPWLIINLLTAFLASAVVGFFEETLSQLTALAILLPIVAGQSGNTGSQAMAVIIRGLALREIRARHWTKVVPKEVLTGFLNGLSISLITGLGVFCWSQDWALSGVLALAMICSMVIASLSGALVPLALSALGKDPAQSSSIILTTVTDVVGFGSFLGLATLFRYALVS